MRVRIVEDEPDLVWLMRDYLERHGVEVEATVNHFEDLFEMAAWENIDVAVVDLLLRSDVTGRQVLRWLAANRPDIRRIVLSAVASIDPEVEGLAHVVATKPTDPDFLFAALGGPDGAG